MSREFALASAKRRNKRRGDEKTQLCSVCCLGDGGLRQLIKKKVARDSDPASRSPTTDMFKKSCDRLYGSDITISDLR
jgi:hypothetical protein